MGRVKRYKKLKSVDPMAKRQAQVVDTTRDEPPELHEERVRKSSKRWADEWDDEDKRERLLQREARRQLKQEAEQKRQGGIKKVEGKKEGEKMRDFRDRMRKETRETLSIAAMKVTKSSMKKKAFLKEKNRAKKTGEKRRPLRSGDDDEDEELGDFTHRGDGYLRASDRGGSDTFTARDNLRFGDRVEDVPNVSLALSAKQKNKMGSGSGKSGLLLSKMLNNSGSKKKKKNSSSSSEKGLSERDLTAARDEARAAYAKLRAKRVEGR